MKVLITVTGVLRVEDEEDLKLLKKASPSEAMDAMRSQATELRMKVEKSVPRKRAKPASKEKSILKKIAEKVTGVPADKPKGK